MELKSIPLEATETRLDAQSKLYVAAWRLALFTVGYNIAEGLIAIYFGQHDESLTLFGFGIDSFIEVISGVGVAHMVMRIRRSPEVDRDAFERTALWITGSGFYGLTVGLLASGLYNLYTGEKPQTTVVGVILSILSIAVMAALMSAKLRVGKALDSSPIVADAHCTRICIQMSVVLLIASVTYELTGIAYIDVLGSLALAYLSFKEGRESFEKARGGKKCACETA